MRSWRKFLIPTIAAAASVLVSACGSASNSSSGSSAPAAQPSSAPTNTVVRTTSASSLGATILVNARGLTLYRLSGETSGKFICTSATCLQNWHPLVATGSKPTGSVGSLGVVKRPDGTMQVTYKGQPLYTFAADHSPGQTKGQGFKDVGTWNAVTTSAAAKANAPAPAPKTSSGGGGGGGYAY